LCAVLAPSPQEMGARLARCLDGAPAQSAWAAAVALSALLLAARRTAYDRTH
ncbi:zf-HC2 domain-containing protein, partial [Streptomyces bauhiniae]|nr:zf-HC2 domain-containing protein [Streptomyces bauhiniae]